MVTEVIVWSFFDKKPFYSSYFRQHSNSFHSKNKFDHKDLIFLNYFQINGNLKHLRLDVYFR